MQHGIFSKIKTTQRSCTVQPQSFLMHISPFTELPKIDSSGGKQQSCLHAEHRMHRAHSGLTQVLYAADTDKNDPCRFEKITLLTAFFGTSNAWRNLTETLYIKTPTLPYSHPTLRRTAQDRQFWREAAKLPTCRAQNIQSSQYSYTGSLRSRHRKE